MFHRYMCMALALVASVARAYGDKPLEGGRHWLEVPRESLWVF